MLNKPLIIMAARSIVAHDSIRYFFVSVAFEFSVQCQFKETQRFLPTSAIITYTTSCVDRSMSIRGSEIWLRFIHIYPNAKLKSNAKKEWLRRFGAQFLCSLERSTPPPSPASFSFFIFISTKTKISLT